jgi:nicotinamidase-related amidase
MNQKLTNNCVESTSRAGLDLGYNVFVVPEATATRALPTYDRRINFLIISH